MGKGGRLVGGLVLLFLLAGITSCGGDSSTEAETDARPQTPYSTVHGASRGFLIPDGDNVIQVFGHDSTPAERERASLVIHTWMRARVAEDWKTDCKFLSAGYSRRTVLDARQTSHGQATNCPQALDFFGDLASGTSGNTLTGPIDSLRVRGAKAFAQWHGPEEDWVLPLREEGGQWKVESASPIKRTG